MIIELRGDKAHGFRSVSYHGSRFNLRSMKLKCNRWKSLVLSYTIGVLH